MGLEEYVKMACCSCVGKPTFRIEGNDVSEGGFEEGAGKGLRNIFFMLTLGFTGCVAADGTDGAAVEVEAICGTTDGLEEEMNVFR
jgi:hypothetical protein